MRALHPTPALGAYPKKEGMQWLENYQTHLARGRYGAPAGYQLDHTATCFVGIRNVQWTADGMFIGAGCGVVAESHADDEWKEIQLKLHAIKEMLAL